MSGGVLLSLELDPGFSSSFVVCVGRLVGVLLVTSVVVTTIVIR